MQFFYLITLTLITQYTSQLAFHLDLYKEEIKNEQYTFQDVPIIDVEAYLIQDSDKMKIECQKVAESLHKFGILIFKDPRAKEEANEEYIDLMENYFDTASQAYYEGQQLNEAKPEFHYQTGVTPEKIEKARDHSERVSKLSDNNKPLSAFPPVYDAKWRYMWKIGERPEDASDNFPQVTPQGFPEWEEKMNSWGNTLLQAGFTAAEMAALGMGLEKDTFTKRMQGGAHLLAPTGTDLQRYDVNTTLAGYHYDIALMTIHGKSRYPGLYVWLRDQTKVAVKIPKGCLLIQAGSTFEHITGGFVLGGFHEVIYSESTKVAMEKTKQEIEAGSTKKLWRVSSTLFSHFRHDIDISPMPELKNLYNPEEAQNYKKMTAFEKLMEELRATSMTQDVDL